MNEERLRGCTVGKTTIKLKAEWTKRHSYRLGQMTVGGGVGCGGGGGGVGGVGGGGVFVGGGPITAARPRAERSTLTANDQAGYGTNTTDNR